MINKDRIVPIIKIDLLSLIGTILAIAGITYAVLKSLTIEGDFEVTGTGAAGNKLADQPVKTLDFKSGVTGATVYFVAAYDFEGFKIAGVATDPAAGSATINKDASTVYKAVLADSAITVTAVTPQ